MNQSALSKIGLSYDWNEEANLLNEARRLARQSDKLWEDSRWEPTPGVIRAMLPTYGEPLLVPLWGPTATHAGWVDYHGSTTRPCYVPVVATSYLSPSWDGERVNLDFHVRVREWFLTREKSNDLYEKARALRREVCRRREAACLPPRA